MKKIYLYLITGCTLFISCTKKAGVFTADAPCQLQTADPSGSSYAADSVISFNCAEKHCGAIPLSKANYWVYLDSVFMDGIFSKTQFDTLRFNTTYKSLSDGLVWWQSNISIGLPSILYSTESGFFGIENRMFINGIKDVRSDFVICAGDSARYLSSFQDMAAQAKSVRYKGMINTPAGNYANIYYFEKNAPHFRKDQVFFKPGIGVLKYIVEKSPVGMPVTKLQQVSTLVSYHFE